MRSRIWTAFFLLFSASLIAGGGDARADDSKRIEDLIKRMTLEEKIELLGGNEFSTKGIARLGIPELKMTDGPLGVRWEKSTAFPSGISMGASFNRDLVEKVAAAMALETRAEGRDMLLGPCVGISRIPFGGRNFEGMGEDPFLTAQLTKSYVTGLNSRKVLGSVKHFGLNDQEHERMTINSVADERTMHEIHFVPFEAAVQSGVGSVMASYNRLNGTYASENRELLTDVLKKKWGFSGFVVSDWGATHSTVPAALAGLDLEMPNGQFFNQDLLKAVQQGQVSESLIDEKVRRILREMFKIGLFDGADLNRPDPKVVNSSEHQALALEMARESHVLLSNRTGLLPFDPRRIKKIAVIGPNAKEARTGGGGSSMVDPYYAISTLEGLRDRLGPAAKIDYKLGVQAPDSEVESEFLTPPQGGAAGLYAEYFNNRDLQGIPSLTRIDSTIAFHWEDGQSPDKSITPSFSARWLGKITAPYTGQYEFATLSDDGVRLWVDGKLLIDNWTDHGWSRDAGNLALEAGRSYSIRLEYYQGSGMGALRLMWTIPYAPLLNEAVQAAARADAVVIAAGFNDQVESEGIDRAGFHLPIHQDQLIKQIARVNPNTVVVINSGNPVSMSAWIGRVASVIYAWYPGQEGGHALADILLGRYNPSGRLPVTMLKRWEDSPAFGTYPEVNGTVPYKEGIFVGYRHFDRGTVAPLFPFGHGLSYTNFTYSGLNVRTVRDSAIDPEFVISAVVTNVGPREGQEVVQLYIGDLEPKVERPVQELKEFTKIQLRPGQSRKIEFHLNRRSFAFYDVKIHDWNALPGRFQVRLGSSSRDIRLIGDLRLK